MKRSAAGMRSRGVGVLRALAGAAVAALGGLAIASAPCGALLSDYLTRSTVVVQPCLVDLQESGLCFALPSVAPAASIASLDAYLADRALPVVAWSGNEAGSAARFKTVAGVTIEIAVASDGPFASLGSCRIVPKR